MHIHLQHNCTWVGVGNQLSKEVWSWHRSMHDLSCPSWCDMWLIHVLWFQDLIEDSVGRFAQIALDPYWWDSYRVTQEKGLLDGVKKTEWKDGKYCYPTCSFSQHPKLTHLVAKMRMKKKNLTWFQFSSSWLSTDLTNLAVIGVIPANINGDRLVVQQITCIASQSWLYKYGRFSSYFLIPRPYAMVSGFSRFEGVLSQNTDTCLWDFGNIMVFRRTSVF